MSQLNPDAKEFVPVSPTRNNAVSPVPNFNRDVVDDTLVARSPRRAMPMDNYVPSPEEFCRGIKQRPSELFEELDKDAENNESQDQNQNGHQLSHQEIMQNLLNGKDPSEIEFHPSNFNNLICKENKENETSPIPEQHDPIAAAEVATTIAAVDAADFATFVPRSQDPMSMSFYEDKNEEGTEFSTNPFNEDLNKVHVLPDFIDDALSQQQQPQQQSKHLEENDDVCELPKSPEQLQTEHVEIAEETITKQEQEDVCSLPKSPIVDVASPVHNVCELPPPVTSESPAESPLPPNDTCEVGSGDICETPKSPIHIDVSETSKSPTPMSMPTSMPDAHSPMELSSPAGPLSPKSPIPELTGLVSPDITASIKDENVLSAEISETAKSPLINETPIEDLEQQALQSPAEQELPGVASPEVADIEQARSPLPTDPSPIEEHTTSKVDEIVCELNKEATDVQELITDAIQDIITSDEASKPREEAPPHVEEHIELSEEAKYLSENITNIANEINEITDEENTADNNIDDFINDLEDKLAENANNLLDCTAAISKAGATEEALNDFIQETEAKSPELNNISIVESEVAPSDIMNSFLDRSVIPEVTSPLSPPEKFEQERPELWKCEFPLPTQHDIKCETIQPEFPVHTIASPSEESKGNDTPPPTPANVTEEPELKRGSPEPQKIVEAVEKLSEPPPPSSSPALVAENKESVPVEAVVAVAAVAATATATATAAAAVSKAKPKVGSISAAATKKTPSKTSPTSPSKTLTSKPTTTTTTTTTAKRTTAPKVTTTTTAAKLAPAKPKTTTTTPTPSPKPISRATATAPKPRTPTSTSTASKLAADKKPLTNGDAKAPIRHTLAKKTTTGTVGAKPATNSTTAASKVSSTKTSTTTTTAARPLANGTSKPALSATKTTARPPLASSAASKPRPASLTSKSTTATSAAKAAPIKSSSTTATKSPGTTTTTKPKPTTTVAPRPRMVLTAKTSVKTADTEKQIKETANKQISASRTSTTRTSSTTTTRTSTTTLKKAAPLSNRTSSTHTRTTTVKSSATGKKPTEVTRTTITKTKSSPIKPNVEQNGVVNVIQEITTVSVVSENDDSQLQLVKDNSPVDAIPPSIVDNSQLPPPMEIIAD